jgi:hypothetical protein
MQRVNNQSVRPNGGAEPQHLRKKLVEHKLIDWALKPAVLLAAGAISALISNLKATS